MITSSWYLFFLLLVSISFIIWLTAYKKVNAFFTLFLAALGVGLLSGLPFDKIIAALKTGFGSTMEKIGLLILLGTSLGVILEKTGATLTMAASILKKLSDKHAPAAISITGVIVGLPIFCDSGFIILSGINHSIVKRARQSMPVMASALATALYSVHCLVPPHPGITAAVGTAAGDIGKVMLAGFALAIPAAILGYWWSVRRGNKIQQDESFVIHHEETVHEKLPSASVSFLPVLLPIVFIALKSVFQLLYGPAAFAENFFLQIISFTGDPVIALGIAMLVSLTLVRRNHRKELNHWLTDAVIKAGLILAITAGGGMFGEMMQATGMGKNLGNFLNGQSLGIFLPFIITAILKTAQGSSTVAIITAVSLLAPVLPDLGLDTPAGTTLAILSMGAGSMVVSHVNDSYFWVISKFSGIDPATSLKVYTVATLFMGLLVQLLIWLISLVVM